MKPPEAEADVALVGGSVKGEGPFRGVVSLGECVLATDRAADMAVERVGREKFCRLLELALLCDVKPA